jgi:hypothetical protein
MTFRAISYGGGVQSTAMVVLAATGVIEADVALFCNVGDDSEHPATLAYVRDVTIPWAAERGLTIHELHNTRHGVGLDPSAEHLDLEVLGTRPVARRTVGHADRDRERA